MYSILLLSVRAVEHLESPARASGRRLKLLDRSSGAGEHSLRRSISAGSLGAPPVGARLASSRPRNVRFARPSLGLLVAGSAPASS